jgi:hypothetical protein
MDIETQISQLRHKKDLVKTTVETREDTKNFLNIYKSLPPEAREQVTKIFTRLLDSEGGNHDKTSKKVNTLMGLEGHHTSSTVVPLTFYHHASMGGEVKGNPMTLAEIERENERINFEFLKNLEYVEKNEFLIRDFDRFIDVIEDYLITMKYNETTYNIRKIGGYSGSSDSLDLEQEIKELNKFREELVTGKIRIDTTRFKFEITKYIELVFTLVNYFPQYRESWQIYNYISNILRRPRFGQPNPLRKHIVQKNGSVPSRLITLTEDAKKALDTKSEKKIKY